MAIITNFVTSGSTNTATDLLASAAPTGFIRVFNLGAAVVYLNVGADAVSTGTLAGVPIAAGSSIVVPVRGQRVSVASGTASIPIAWYEEPTFRSN
jgi:hypothetical protein